MRTGEKRNDKCRIKVINKICYLLPTILAIQYSYNFFFFVSFAMIVVDMQYYTSAKLFGNIHFQTQKKLNQ